MANLTFNTGLPRDAELTGALDWRRTGPQTWSFDVETTHGTKLTLADGGARLEVEGQVPS